MRPGRGAACRLLAAARGPHYQYPRGSRANLGTQGASEGQTGRGRFLRLQTRAPSRYREEGGAAGVAARPEAGESGSPRRRTPEDLQKHTYTPTEQKSQPEDTATCTPADQKSYLTDINTYTLSDSGAGCRTVRPLGQHTAPPYINVGTVLIPLVPPPSPTPLSVSLLHLIVCLFFPDLPILLVCVCVSVFVCVCVRLCLCVCSL